MELGETKQVSKQRSPVSLRIPEPLKQEAKAEGEKQGLKLNAFIVEAVREKIERDQNPKEVADKAIIENEIKKTISSIKNDTDAVRDQAEIISSQTNHLKEVIRNLDTSISTHSLTKKELWETVAEITRHKPNIEAANNELIKFIKSAKENYLEQDISLRERFDSCSEAIGSWKKMLNSFSQQVHRSTSDLSDIDLSQVQNSMKYEREEFKRFTHKYTWNISIGVITLIFCMSLACFYLYMKHPTQDELANTCYQAQQYAIKQSKTK